MELLRERIMWKQQRAELLQNGQRVVMADGIKTVEKVEKCIPLGLAEVEVTWKGGQVEKFCYNKNLLMEIKDGDNT